MMCNKTWSDWPDLRLVLETVINSGVVVDTVCPGYNETALTEGAIENIAQ